MPPPGRPRMTQQPDRSHRYRPGKRVVDEDSEDEIASDDDLEPPSPTIVPSRVPAPVISTFPAHKKLPPAPIPRKPEIDLEGFETASESSSAEADDADDSEESDEESSEENESESEEEVKPRLIAPKFISKAQRARLTSEATKTVSELAAEEEARRKEKTAAMLQAQLERQQAARAADKKAWDDDDDADDVDDTDGLDPEAEQAAWRLRELKRVKRDRLALIEKEQEREEIERRKNLTTEEREAEDRDFIDQQKADQDGRGKMSFMQKYYHKGAFFQGDEEQDEEVKAALSRDLAGAHFVDESNKETLPEYMRIRDMTQLGRKSRSKYKDLKAEDTGQWGDFGGKRSLRDGLDDRFRPDGGSSAQTGANAAPVGTRRTREDDDARRDEKRPRYG